MKKILSLLVLLLLATAYPVQAQQAFSDKAAAPAQRPVPGNRIEQLTGKVWLESSTDSKLGVLFGIELALNVDKAIEDRLQKEMAAEKGKKAKGPKRPPYRGSPFARAWFDSFHDMPLPDIALKIDAWYAVNPDKTDRLVLDVVWNELMTHPTPQHPAR